MGYLVSLGVSTTLSFRDPLVVVLVDVISPSFERDAVTSAEDVPNSEIGCSC